MALRRLISQVKRHKTRLREFSYLAAQPYRTSQHARGGVQRLSSSIGTSTLGRSNYSGRPARGLRDTEGSSSASYLRELNLRNDPEAVIRLFESQPSLHNNPSARAECLWAKVARLEQIVKTLHRGVPEGPYSMVDKESVGALSFLINVGKSSKDGVLGTASALFHMVTAKGGHFTEHLWRTVCALGLAILLILGFGALIVDRGIGKGLGLHLQEEVQPTMESNIKFSDVKGLDEAKAELEKIVHYLRDPKPFFPLIWMWSSNAKDVLLVGPPGSGKTMLARAMAGEAGVPFFSFSCSEFEEMSVGVGAQRVRDVFTAAKKRSPCVIFIDEIDAIGGSRNPKDQQDMIMTLNQLLVELDGIKRNEGIIVIAATTSAESLDKALVPPGLLDCYIEVPNPDVEGRRQILEAHMSKVLKVEDVDLMIIARGTLGFSGADLANLINIAAHKAEIDGSLAVSMADLEHAKNKIMMESEVKSACNSPKRRKMVAYHEGGHTLVAIHSGGAFPLQKVSIVPEGNSLGRNIYLPNDDILPRFYISRKKWLAHVDVILKKWLAHLDMYLGGMAAEGLVFSDITKGCSPDIREATKLAKFILDISRISIQVGFFTHTEGDNDKSNEQEVMELLARAYSNAQTILTTHIKELHALANALLEHETLSVSQIKAILAQTNSEEQLLTTHENELHTISRSQIKTILAQLNPDLEQIVAVQSSSQSDTAPPSPPSAADTAKEKGIAPVGSEP